MKMMKYVGAIVTLAGVGVLALVLAPSVSGQSWTERSDSRQDRFPRELLALDGRGSEIGVSIAEAKAGATGVVVEDVRPESPAEKAGVRKADLIVEFDGERVRSTRQFGRLVQETPAGKTVKATVMRDGQKKDVQITPSEGRGQSMVIAGDRLRQSFDNLGNLTGKLAPFDFSFDFDVPGMMSGRRLGVTVDGLTDQLAEYFGAKAGVLVTSVSEGSAAAKAGLKAGDVITAIDSRRVSSPQDLVRELRDANAEDVTIGIVRDKKESTVKAKIEAPARRTLRGARPV